MSTSNLSNPHEPDFAAVPWYADEASYLAIRGTALDQDDFFPEYSEWCNAALAHERAAARQGVTLLRIRMQFDAFTRWCDTNGGQNDAAGRSRYANLLGRRLFP